MKIRLENRSTKILLKQKTFCTLSLGRSLSYFFFYPGELVIVRYREKMRGLIRCQDRATRASCHFYNFFFNFRPDLGFRSLGTEPSCWVAQGGQFEYPCLYIRSLYKILDFWGVILHSFLNLKNRFSRQRIGQIKKARPAFWSALQGLSDYS